MQDVYGLYKDPVGILLIMYSVVALALIAERAIVWFAAWDKGKITSWHVRRLAKSPDREKFRELFGTSTSPLAQAMGSVLAHDTSESPETTLLLLDDALEDVSGRYKRNLVLLAALAGTAPFLGLLGTVLGIMNTFTDIMKRGFGGPTVIAFGISRALQTTAAGLVIAGR